MEYDPIITLTTDFGKRDPFVGIMKGVILNINPLVRVIDITHDVNPQNIVEASYAIGTSFSYFPHKTIHVVVVDPDVGSMRRPILVAGGFYYFVGPDNGVFSRIYEMSKNIGESVTVFHITATHYFLSHESSTFHGRDVFAPVAAWLSKGINITKFGEPIDDYVTIPMKVPVLKGDNVIEGEVVYIDRFGNLITNISIQEMNRISQNRSDRKLAVMVKDKEVPLKDYYSQATGGGMFSLFNSFGYLELFVNKGNASLNYGIAVGEKVSVVLS